MNRREFLGAMAAAPSRPARRPNVMLIAVDDMNDWVNCLNGYAGVRTPNIDRLARGGVLFSDAHCAAPLCNPSRTALFTGLSPATSGIYNNDQWWRPALPDVVTMPQYFKRNGYHVAGAGKVFHHVAGFNPPDQWDEFQLQEFDDPWYRRAEWYPWVKKIPAPAGHPFNGLRDFPGEFDWGVLPKAEREYGDFRAIEFAERFLARSYQKPFFLAVGLWHPHIPLFAPKNYFDLYPQVKLPDASASDLDDVPAVGRQFAAARREEFERIVREGKWEEAVRAYLAAISFADAMVGRITAALDSSPHARDTILVFFSDNGWHLGEKRHFHKSTLWQRSTHVPLVVRAPGAQRAGARRQPVSLLDLYPTLVELCGLPRKQDLDGLSLAPLLRDPRAARRPAVITYLPGNHAVCTERWRYIRYRDGGEELYDRNADPNEFRNLAGETAHEGLKQDLARWMPKTSAPPKPQREAYDFDFATHTWRLKG
ncbi:MAG: sulfatase [Bryobacteraceae bacterium]